MSITSWEEYIWVLMLKSHVYEGWVSSIIILSSLKQINISFRGPYISRIAIKFIFAETNFVDCMTKATPTQVLLQLVGL